MRSISIAWVGRLTGPKGELAYRIVKDVAPHFPDAAFTMVGEPITQEFRDAAPVNVSLRGFVDDVDALIREHDLVIGAGQVALEVMRARVPVIAVGECVYVGPVTGATIAQAKATNFGDCASPPNVDIDRLVADLRLILAGEKEVPVERYADYLQEYDAEQVYANVMRIYQQAEIDAYLGRFSEIPVLVYHRVVETPPTNSRFNIFVTQADLRWQLGALKKRGFQAVTFRDILNGARPPKPVMLTFDDGYEDNLEKLLPLLDEHDAKAVVFVLGDRTMTNNAWDMAQGEPEARLMNDTQVRACHTSGRIEIGSHGLLHRRFPKLEAVEVEREVVDSKHVLEDLISDEVVSFAYPYGEYGQREVAAVRNAGYRFGIGTSNGPMRMIDDLYRIRRIPIFARTSRAAFWKKTSGYYLRYCRLKRKDF
ncbi:MAG: polysaccharide deacetylase family protein [Acidiferrobacterales bacterium]